MNSSVKNIFYPKTLCIVGASSKEKSIGYEILRSIKDYQFCGEIFPVNPNTDNILGYKCYKSILDIDSAIDLAVVVVPKKFVNESLDQLISKNVKSVILITAGFRETGEQGALKEKEIIAKLKESNVRMIGPNCMGVINTNEDVRLNATFVAEKPAEGGTGFLSQSGALGAAVLNSLRETDIKFAHFISIGNKADLSENEIVEFWLEDPKIKTIALYLESFSSGLKFIKTYIEMDRNKPIIILKAGKTEDGMKAASSHTGALSSNDIIVDSILNQFGIIRVETLNEMFNTAKGFEHFPLPKGNRIAIATNAGGPAILAVDNLEKRGLHLSNISDKTKLKLKEIVHPEGSINNPVDLLPGGTPQNYKKVNEILIEDENVDAVISIFVEPVMVNAFDVIEAVNSISKEKPIYQVCMPLPEFWDEYRNKSSFNCPIFRNPEDPSELISNILHYQSYKDESKSVENINIHSNNVLGNSEFLDNKNVVEICRAYDIPLIENKVICLDRLDTLDNLKYPIVLKGVHKNLIHKSELNAVKLNLKNQDEFLDALYELRKDLSGNKIELEEVLIQNYIDIKHELLIGGYRDPSFGPIVMFGSGGKYVEILNDVQLRSAYISDVVLDDLISKTKVGKIIKGVRGEAGVDINRLKSIIKGVAKLLIENNNVQEIDINPLAVDKNLNFYAVDVRIKSL